MILLVEPFIVSLYLVSFITLPQETFYSLNILSLHTDTDRNCFLIIKQLIMYRVYSVLKRHFFSRPLNICACHRRYHSIFKLKKHILLTEKYSLPLNNVDVTNTDHRTVKCPHLTWHLVFCIHVSVSEDSTNCRWCNTLGIYQKICI